VVDLFVCAKESGAIQAKATSKKSDTTSRTRNFMVTIPATTTSTLFFMKNKKYNKSHFVTLKLLVSALVSILLLEQIILVHPFALNIRCNSLHHQLRRFDNNSSRIRRTTRSFPCRGDCTNNNNYNHKMGFEKSSSLLWNVALSDSEEESFDDYNPKGDIYDDDDDDVDIDVNDTVDEYDDDALEFEKYQVGEASPTLQKKNDSRNLPPPPPSMNMYDDRPSAYLLPRDSQLQLQIQQQQKQIDMLMNMIKGSSQPPIQASEKSRVMMRPGKESVKVPQVEDEEDMLPPPLPGMFDDDGEDELLDTTSQHPAHSSYSTPAPFYSSSGVVPLAPLKAMLFIDGTWLYYSLYRRKEEFDPIVKKFGKGWQYRYRFDWNALPRIVCEQIVGQQMNLGWSSNGPIGATGTNNQLQSSSIQRPVEIVRASVFTSYKKTTDPRSFRVRMYNEMANANYDIHMLESTSNGPEKCVDISLAVEMLHYATVPNAYDIAILLSGDKDFIPAMVRTRQKGRKVGVVSMRTGCNRGLYENSHIKDFDVVWLDDFLDRLLVPLPANQVGKTVQSVHDRGHLSAFTITKVILDFVSQSPYGKVSSRDVGRYLKNLELPGGTSMLDDVKVGQGGLRRFLQDRMPMVFDVSDRQISPMRDPNDRTYWIGKKEGASAVLLDEAKRTKFTPEEKQFLEDYHSGVIEKGLEKEIYHYTIEAMEYDAPEIEDLSAYSSAISGLDSSVIRDQQLPRIEYSTLTVVELKEMCKQRGLPVSGRKADLSQRLEEADSSAQISSTPEDSISTLSEKSYNDKLDKHLVELVKYYIVQCGGYASSRDLGRFLSTNRASNSNTSALTELKNHFGGVASFLNQQSHIFTIVREPTDGDPRNFSFGIKLRDIPPAVNSNVSLNNSYVSQVSTSKIPPPTPNSPVNMDPNVDAHIEELIREYLHASGGEASSRNIGRYLAANAAFPAEKNEGMNGMVHGKNRDTALKQLKQHYGSLAFYLSTKEDVFDKVSGDLQSRQGGNDSPPDHSFGVRLK